MLNIKTLRYQRDSPRNDLVAPEVYNLSDLDWAYIKVLCEIVMVFKLAQETLEGSSTSRTTASSLSSRRSVLISS